MDLDLQKIGGIDLSYPGVSYHHFLRGFQVYLENLEEFIIHTGDQYQLRSQRLIKNRGDEIDDIVYMKELEFIKDVAKKEIPGYARMSAIVLLWGMFEAMVEDVAKYVSEKEGISKQLTDKDLKKQRFVWRARKYYERELQTATSWKEKECQDANKLNLIRDKIAHRNGKFWDVPEKEIEEFSGKIVDVDGVSIIGRQLVVSREYLNSSTVLVFDILKCLNNSVCTRYNDLNLLTW